MADRDEWRSYHLLAPEERGSHFRDAKTGMDVEVVSPSHFVEHLDHHLRIEPYYAENNIEKTWSVELWCADCDICLADITDMSALARLQGP